MPPYRLRDWLSISGPVVDVLVSWGPSGRPLEALIDTGADITCIPERMARDLSLRQISEEPVSGVCCETTLPLFVANLSIEGVNFPNLPVVGYDDDYGLIGRDILNQLVTHLDGLAQQLTLQQPTV